MYKTGNILSFLKKNNNKEFRKFAENELSLKDISDKFNVSNQLALNTVKKIDPDIINKREQDINQRLREIYDMLLEGVPIDYIINETSVAKPFKRNFKTSSMNSRKDAMIAKIKRHGVNDDEDFRRFVVITNKLKNYISILQIEDSLLNTKPEDVNMYRLSLAYDVSYTKVLERNQNLKKQGRAITTIDDDLYEILKRNIKIAERYAKGESVRVLSGEFKDLKYLDLIVKTYQPYIKVV